jgi:exosome complex component RRP41
MEKSRLVIGGKRLDNRKIDELRKLNAELNISKSTKGSAMFTIGNTIAVAAIYGPMEVFPRFLEDNDKAVLEVNYNMLPFSTDDRNRPGFSRRSTEISAVIKRVLENVIFLEDFPKTKITINVDILSADASTRCAAINAASLALALAGIPMKDLVASCSAGKIENTLVLDVAGKEDTEGEVDLPIAYLPLTDEVLLLQMDGILKKEEFEKLMELAKKGCKQIYEFQKKSLLEFKSKLENE